MSREPSEAPGGMRISRSHRLETLVEALAERVRAPLATPFAAETVVVPSRAMGDWLGLRLAERLGVWANPAFVTLDRLALDLAGVPADAFSEASLTWAISASLPPMLPAPELAPVAAYLADDVDGTKRFALARRLAATFSRYLLHRPETILGWEKGEASVEGDAAWQAILFRAVVDRLGTEHRARRVAQLVERLHGGSREGVPERISVFSPEGLPAVAAQLLEALAVTTSVEVFVRSAGGHELAESLGARGGETLAMLAARTRRPVVDLDSGAAPRTLPVHVGLHSCHGPMREAEVLRDQLLAALSEDPTLEARDVLVLCPDLETYAPAIEAAFGVPSEDPKFLPFRIVDRPVRRQMRVVDAFLALLDLAPGRLGAPEVVDVFTREPVRARFGVEETDVDTVRSWVLASGIRWGEDEAHREEEGQPALRANTWRFGLDRLLLGYAMAAGEERATCAGVLPYDDVEGGRAAPLGGLASFCEALFGLRREVKGRASLQAWRERLERALATFVVETWQTEPQHRRIREALASVVAAATRAGFQEDVPFAVVRDALAAELEDRGLPQDTSVSAVTFASFTSSRCVPARVVALLGMNDGDVPRAPRVDGFDVLAETWLPGDPSPREDDRQAFLDAVLAARDRLVVSWVGQSIATNAERPPSVLVGELVEILPASERARAVVRHPLHAFSPSYFGAGEDPRLFSHAESLAEGARAMAGGASRPMAPFITAPLPPADLPRTVQLDVLARFFEHPVRAFMTTRLRVSFGSDVDVLEDREPLELDGLGAWKVGDELLRRPGQVPEEVPFDLIAEGALPPGVLGVFEYDEVGRKVAWMKARIAEVLGDAQLLPARPFDVDVAGEGTLVLGVARRTTPDLHLVTTFSSIAGKHKVSAWVRHVAMSAAGLALRTVLVCKNKVWSLAPLPRAEAERVLSDLVALYWRGLEAPLLFFPDTSIAYAEARATGGEQRGLEQARNAFPGDYGGGACAYVFRAFRGAVPIEETYEPFELPRDRSRWPSFASLATRIVEPMRAAEERA